VAIKYATGIVPVEANQRRGHMYRSRRIWSAVSNLLSVNWNTAAAVVGTTGRRASGSAAAGHAAAGAVQAMALAAGAMKDPEQPVGGVSPLGILFPFWAHSCVRRETKTGDIVLEALTWGLAAGALPTLGELPATGKALADEKSRRLSIEQARLLDAQAAVRAAELDLVKALDAGAASGRFSIERSGPTRRWIDPITQDVYASCVMDLEEEAGGAPLEERDDLRPLSH
jgi:hypothetical protein